MRRRNPKLFRTKPRTMAQIRRDMKPKRTSLKRELRAWKKPLGGVKREGKAFAKGFLSAGLFMVRGPRRRR